MEKFTEPEAMRRRTERARAGGARIGFVPTMGFLHEGHASLLRRARRECGFVVASIFVNPAQFGPREDYARYPRDLDRDVRILERLEIDALFHPEPSAIYPGGYRTWVTVEGLSEVLCGASRPGHFRGVATIVLKLFNIIGPDAAYFGQKDAQQAILIRTMARDLNVAARIEICPTVREPDGLAVSSRNSYLSEPERAAAPVIYRALSAAREAFVTGERSSEALLETARRVLREEPLFDLEYLELVRADDLGPIGPEGVRGEALLAVAGRIGTTRLIDNVMLHDETTITGGD